MIWHRLTLLFKQLSLFWVCVCVQAWAGDLTTSRAYFEDPSGHRSFQQVQSEHFTPYDGVLSRGYTQSAIWIKLQITPPPQAQADELLVLRIKPVFLDEIQLFDPLDTGTAPRTAGDATPFDRQEFQSLFHTFVIPAGPAPRSVWLRVVTTSTSLVNVRTYTQAQMRQDEFESQIYAFVVIAIMGMFLLQVLVNWVNHREALYALFVARQCYFFVYTVALFGLHRYLLHDYLLPQQLDAFFSWCVVGATTLTYLFERQFLTEYKLKPWGKAALNSLLMCSVAVWLTMALGFTLDALRWNMLLNVAGLVLLLVIAVFCIDSQVIRQADNTKLLDKRWVVGYYLIITVVMFLSSLLSFLGLTKGNYYTEHSLVFYTLISGVSMTILMQLRTNKLVKAQNDYEKNLILSQQQAALEKQRREEQAHLLHMLMHELKNPLAIIEMAQRANNDKDTTADYISRSVQNMKDVIDRCVKTDKLAQGNIELHIEAVDVNLFVENCLADRTQDNNDTELLLGKDLRVQTDVQLLGIMLNNLLDNAQRYGDPRVPIELSTQARANAQGIQGVAITVANRPSAASWPDVERVFTKYYRSKGAEVQSGTGLGLYLVRTMATLVGGDCRYVPDDKNIRFELWLPS